MLLHVFCFMSFGEKLCDLWTDRRITLDGGVFVKLLNNMFSLFFNESCAHSFVLDLSVT